MIASRVKTIDGYEDITAYLPAEAEWPIMSYKLIQRGKAHYKYATEFIVLDTETAHKDEETGWVYQWAMKLKNLYLYGRTPEDLLECLRIMAKHYDLNEKRKFVLYIHNAAYDTQYLKHFFRKYDPELKIMATDAHAVLFCEIFGFRILCSYRMTGYSLAALAKYYAHKYVKAVGEIDYSEVHYQDEELKPENWEYMFSDVASQADGIRGYLDVMGYKYACEAPMTATGFVRDDSRRAAAAAFWRKAFVESQLELEQYKLLRWAFMGGVTICNYLYAGETVRACDEFELGHDDFKSSYPARQMLDYMPEGKGSWYGEIESEEELQELLDTRCCIFILTLHEVHIKTGVTAPYIPSSKCIGLEEPVRINGKIVYAKRLSIAVTEIDYKWIRKQYEAEQTEVSNILTFKRGKCPDWMRSMIMKYFENKCTKKNSEYAEYMRSKALLNAIYGMSATALLREQYDTTEDLEYKPREYASEEEKRAAEEKELKHYYNSYNSFMPYQYAPYTTAWARDALFTMIETVGYEHFLYCDTDSVFYMRTPEVEKRMRAYRESCIERARSAGAYVDDQYLGAPYPEPEIRAFRGLHAKCYAMEEFDKDKGDYELKVVIAGIPKKSIKWIDGKPVTMTNAEELGSIDKLEDGFIFKHNGGTRCAYCERDPEVMDIDGHKTILASSAVIEPIEKRISDSMLSVDGNTLIKLQQFYL